MDNIMQRALKAGWSSEVSIENLEHINNIDKSGCFKSGSKLERSWLELICYITMLENQIKMQPEQESWSSEVPKEEGGYAFYDIDNKEYSIVELRKENDLFIANFIDMSGDGIFLNDVVDECLWLKVPKADGYD